jgi:hypothetical protein
LEMVSLSNLCAIGVLVAQSKIGRAIIGAEF